ncbi:MAG: hypothetical protein JXQ73_15580 [Phycisphaerae bacterium]|nr:hypothetical protein [Phycisphaerae bacterium]
MADHTYVQPAARALFEHLGLSDFDSVMSLSGGMTVSRHKSRNTMLIMPNMTAEHGWGDRRVYLKRDYRVPLKHVLEDLLARRLPRAQPLREWLAIERCQRRGIGVMRGLAWGQRSVLGIPRQAFILVEAVPGMETLHEATQRLCGPDAGGRPNGRLAAERRQLARELGEFVGRFHAGKLIWPDMVGKHIYLTPRSGENRTNRWDFHLIDVERLTRSRSPAKQTKDLIRLYRSLSPHGLSPTDLLRFALGYLNVEAEDWPAARRRIEQVFAWAGDLVRRSWASRRPRLPRADDAPRPEQLRFVRFGNVVVNHAFIPILQDSGLVSFGSVFRLNVGERLDKANIGSWRERWRLDLEDYQGSRRTLYLKRYQSPPLGEQLKRIFFRRAKRASAWWEWQRIRNLAAEGIGVPTPVGYGQKMRGFVERRSFLVTEAIPGESLERWVPRHLGPDGDVDWRTRRKLVGQLALLIRLLHEKKWAHRDLYLSHIFISHNADGQAVFRLIDLQRLFRPRWRWRRWRIKDLAALHYSTPAECVPATDRLRFLRHYFNVPRLTPAHRRLIRRVLAKTRRTARHNRPRP